MLIPAFDFLILLLKLGMLCYPQVPCFMFPINPDSHLLSLFLLDFEMSDKKGRKSMPDMFTLIGHEQLKYLLEVSRLVHD